jgi:plastocyanin
VSPGVKEPRMSRRSPVSLPALALAAALAVGCDGPRTSAPQAPAPEPAKHPMAAPQPKEAAAQVTIDNFSFNPVELTVAAGTRVTWVNRDDVPHTATSTAKPKIFDSGTLDTDQKFSHVFDKPGVYEYFCAVHPKMTARVVVK